jgi:peptidoglycan-associated lipoprotein
MHLRFAVVFAALGLADLAYIDLELGPRVLASAASVATTPASASAAAPNAGEAAATPAASKPAPASSALEVQPAAPQAMPGRHAEGAPTAENAAAPAPASTVWALKYFDTSRAALSRDEVDELRKIVGQFPSNEALEIRVVGHADARGRRDENWQLARRRAQAVAAGLRQLGFTPERLVVRSEGEDAPAVPGTNEQALAENRRVEIVISAKRSR